MTIKNRETLNFYTEAPARLVIFSFFSAGLYNMYYFYKNFLKNSDASSQLVLVAKSILYPFFCFGLLKKASKNTGDDSKSSVKVVLLWGALFIFVYAGGLLQGDLKYLAFATFIPLLGINSLFKRTNSRI